MSAASPERLDAISTSVGCRRPASARHRPCNSDTLKESAATLLQSSAWLTDWALSDPGGAGAPAPPAPARAALYDLVCLRYTAPSTPSIDNARAPRTRTHEKVSGPRTRRMPSMPIATTLLDAVHHIVPVIRQYREEA